MVNTSRLFKIPTDEMSCIRIVQVKDITTAVTNVVTPHEKHKQKIRSTEVAP